MDRVHCLQHAVKVKSQSQSVLWKSRQPREEMPMGEERKLYAQVSWCIEDLKSIKACAGWSDTKRHEFFDDLEDQLQDAMITTGWGIIYKEVECQREL
tara:strand:- start:544 stop:837 length:294 start_codon:yes stop_codon:yes gene_type:complete